jgi:3-hydroxybutyrate dehydrogenase
MNKVALITGSTSGIGLGIAKNFAAAGYDLMLHGLEENGNEIAASMEKEYGVLARFSNANLLEASQVERLVQQTIEELGGLHILINNAGIQYVSDIASFPNKKYEQIIAINMNSSFYAIKAAWPQMEQQQFGRIINISSVHGIRASKYKVAYITAKHGVIGMTKCLALEGADKNITCNAICPGYVKTPLVEAQIADQAKAHGLSEEEVVTKVMLRKQAVKEFIPINTIAQTSLLLSDESSTAITGSIFTLDGGWSAQ